MPLTKIPLNMLDDTSGSLGFRNRIINGDMRISQRGTSFTAQGYTLDRWYQLLSGGTATVTQETFPLGSEVSGCSNYLKQATSVGNDYCGLIYKVEDVKSLPQGTATISFYAKGTNPSSGSFQLVIYRMHDGSTVYDTLLNTTITVTSSWQRFTRSFTVPTLAGMSTPTANSLIYVAIRQSDSDTSTAAWELNLTAVQLEVGSTATPFDYRPYGTELALCQRYYIKIAATTSGPILGLGAADSSTTSQHFGSLPVQMRSSPTYSFSSVNVSTLSGSVYAVTGNNGINSDGLAYRVFFAVGGGGLTATTVPYFARANTTGYVDFSAEL